MKTIRPTMLIVLDGFGYSKKREYNAIAYAQKPGLDYLFKTYPHAIIGASGKYVGLLDGYIGNSEVGHMTMGAGRIIEQPVSFLQTALDDGSFFSNPVLVQGLQKVSDGTGRLHIMGLLSDAGVHGHTKHLYAFLKAAKQQGVGSVYVHIFLDGRDVGPQTAATFIKELCEFMEKEGVGMLGSLHGRFYAMDRDKNWERTEKSYAVLTGNAYAGDGGVCADRADATTSWQAWLDTNYKKGITDEFISPLLLNKEGIIQKGDGIIFFNFRPDRARQITTCFVDSDFDAFKVGDLSLSCFITPVAYADSLKTGVMFKKNNVENTLIEVLSKHEKSVLTIAETEKYAHVTYFFKGGREKRFEYETNILIPSLKMENYAKTPCMSAKIITDTILQSLRKDPKDFYLVNYANADMVGHSGDFEATVKAVECLDHEVQKLYDMVVKKMDGILYITADHGNAEQMFDPQIGQPHTAHTTNPVPFFMIKKGLEHSAMPLPITQLSDIAPFVLHNMGIAIPSQMQKKGPENRAQTFHDI